MMHLSLSENAMSWLMYCIIVLDLFLRFGQNSDTVAPFIKGHWKLSVFSETLFFRFLINVLLCFLVWKITWVLYYWNPWTKAMLPHSVSCQTCIKYKADSLLDLPHFFHFWHSYRRSLLGNGFLCVEVSTKHIARHLLSGSFFFFLEAFFLTGSNYQQVLVYYYVQMP